jgi:hypothetical protein
VTKVFIIPFHVKRMSPSIMPMEFSEAYVSCYTSGENYVEATKKSLKTLLADGLHPHEVLQPIFEMDSANWIFHVLEKWPEYEDSLPNQADFERTISDDKVVYRPFGAHV